MLLHGYGLGSRFGKFYSEIVQVLQNFHELDDSEDELLNSALTCALIERCRAE